MQQSCVEMYADDVFSPSLLPLPFTSSCIFATLHLLVLSLLSFSALSHLLYFFSPPLSSSLILFKINFFLCSFTLLTCCFSSHFLSTHNHLQFEIRQLRAHLAQQDLDLAAEREAAMQIHHVWGKQGRSFQVVEGLTPGESDDEGSQRNPREPRAPAGTVWSLEQSF